MSSDDLEARVAALEAENEQLRERLGKVESVFGTIGDVNLDEVSAKDLLLADEALFRSLEQRKKEIRTLEEYIFGERLGSPGAIQSHIEHAGTLDEKLSNGDVSDGPPAKARKTMLPIHEMWADIKHGRDDRIGQKKIRRAAILFGELALKASGKPRAAVDASSGLYKIRAPDAKQPILEAEDDLDNVYPDTVKRAFRELQRLTKSQECDCDSIEVCDHGLVVAHFDGGTNKVVTEADRFHAYLRTVQTAIESADGLNTADDPGNAGEAADVEAEFGRLEKATVGNGVKANVDVSSDDGPTLDRAKNGHGGDPPTRVE